MKNKVLLFFIGVILCSMDLFAQERKISGIVKGENDQELIIGANVIIKGTRRGTVTNTHGKFTISVGQSDKELEISYVGMQKKTIKLEANKSSYVIELEEEYNSLEDVIVIGYGTQAKRDVIGSITTISSKDLDSNSGGNINTALQGKIPGMQIISTSGEPGAGSLIQIRGASSINGSSEPLYIIDGTPIESGNISSIDGDATFSPIAGINPNDIESIEVLKDAASAAIYGSRAAGGVILITTKRGSGSRTQINYDGYLTASTIANKPDMLNASEWRAANKALGKDISTYDKYNSDTDWFDEMTRVGVSQQHALSLSGGSSKSNYRASYTFLDRNGVARDNYMTRHSFRFQFQQRAINDRLRIGLTGAATLTDMQMPFSDDYILAYNMLPVYPVYNADGSYFTDANHNYDQGNPVQNQDQNYKKAANNYFYGQGDVQFSILDGLTTKVNLYKSRFSSDYSEWQDPRNSRGQGDTGKAIRRNRLWDRNLLEWTANYTKAFGSAEEHKVDAIVGYSWENNLYADQKSEATNFAVGSMGADNIQSGNLLKIGNVTSSRNEYKLISLFARAHYSFKERYMITATVRRDGSSKFGANHKWGTFPSVSAAWGISQESFMKDTKWINDLKLRAGYGITGNQDGLRPYKSLDLYSASGTYYNNGSWPTAFRPSQNANPNLKWEQTAMLNIGLDFTLFNSRLSGTIEWYDKRTKDMLYNYEVSTPTYVYNQIQANVGDMKNTGVEILLNLDVIRNKDFTWTTSLNLAHNKNEITKLSNELFSTGRVYVGDPWIRGASGVTSHVVEEGRPVGQFFMLKCNGLDENGKFIIEDINGDGQITDDDRTYVGDAQPDLTYGWNNTFNWKNWDASFFFRGTIGNKVLNNPLAAYGNNTYIDGTNVMDNDNLLTLSENSRVCSYYVENASFLRLDNLSIGYTFNTKKIDWLDKARLYVAGQNLFVITGYKGLDPEVENFRGEASDDNAGLSPGIEPRNYMPKARSFTFGVNLTF